MSIKGSLIDLNNRFKRSVHQNFLQDVFRSSRETFKDAIFNILSTGATVESYPKCFCGRTKYESNLGEFCQKCQTFVVHRGEHLENLFHLEIPAGIVNLLNPKVYTDLIELCKINKRNNSGGFNPILFLTMPGHKPKGKNVAENNIYRRMLGWDIWENKVNKPGWNFFVSNLRPLVARVFDEIITERRQTKLPLDMKAMLDVLSLEDNFIFCNKLPVINKLLLTLESAGDIKRKVPTTSTYGIAVTDFVRLPIMEDLELRGTPLTSKELAKAQRVVAKSYYSLDIFLKETITREGKKGGTCRSDIMGVRSPFTYRGVVTQITDPHLGHDVWMPYTAMTVLLEPYIMNILSEEVQPGWDRLMLPSEILEYITEHRRVFCENLHDIMTRIINSFTEFGMPIYQTRYPILYQQSGLLEYCVKIKKDPKDKTVSVPAAANPARNGDFDGDNYSGCLIVDIVLYEHLQIAHISKALMDINTPYKFSGAAGLPPPVIQSWSNMCYFHAPELSKGEMFPPLYSKLIDGEIAELEYERLPEVPLESYNTPFNQPAGADQTSSTKEFGCDVHIDNEVIRENRAKPKSVYANILDKASKVRRSF